jgi:hypothetical protein
MALADRMRSWLRAKPRWVRFRELQREGFLRAARRSQIERKILDTRPISTPSNGPLEVRILTWRRDWIAAIWAIKAFFHASGQLLPLFIHDGGLTPDQRRELSRHFPSAILVDHDRANSLVVPELCRRGCARSAAYRDRNGTVRKLFDFFLMSKADSIISIDSDIIFFRRPDELLSGTSNLFNRDQAYHYTLPLDELENAFGIRPVPLVNSGLSRVRREVVDFEKIEQWLAHPGLYNNVWVTEQTVMALCASIAGFEFLPQTYEVGAASALSSSAICRHYPGEFRSMLYTEGMTAADAMGIVEALK